MAVTFSYREVALNPNGQLRCDAIEMPVAVEKNQVTLHGHSCNEKVSKGYRNPLPPELKAHLCGFIPVVFSY